MFSSFRETLRSESDIQVFDALVTEAWKSKQTRLLCFTNLVAGIVWQIFSAFFIWAPVIIIFAALCFCHFDGVIFGTALSSFGDRIRDGGNFVLLGTLWIAFGYMSFELSMAAKKIQLPIDKYVQKQFLALKLSDTAVTVSNSSPSTTSCPNGN